MNRPYLLFDAGGTLVFPDESFLIEEARNHGMTLTPDQLFEGYYRTVYRWDRTAQSCPKHPPLNPWPRGYAHTLFETLGITNPITDRIAETFNVKHKKENLWTYTLPEVKEVLTFLSRQGYRMSVLSNSDGRTREVFCHPQVGLAGFFERIFDSKLIGYEKPDPRIFEHVLAELKLRPAEVIYIGDVFWVDIQGARRAKLRAIHLDPLDLYKGRRWSAIRLSNIYHLPQWLAEQEQKTTSSISHSFVQTNPLSNLRFLVDEVSYTPGDSYEHSTEMATFALS
ncbi:MAG: HAD-IA family hydrolase [Anaerolineales bacterium]|nr:HAD-IA family hydrolase [Anaerolineales bacterium]